MRVFVLSTGRCGSTTFAEACRHLTNFSSGHETLAAAHIFDDRFGYPDQHIEVDNRLSWFLGELGERFDDTETLYVHLTRDPEAVAESFLKRFDSEWRGSIIRAFAHGVLMKASPWDAGSKLDVCRFYVETVNRNISEFLRSRIALRVELENAHRDFAEFLRRIGAQGDTEAALLEWNTKHNRSR